MRLRDFVLIVCSFGVGVGMRTIFYLPNEVVLICLLVSITLGLLWRRSSTSGVLLGSLCFLFLGLGIFRTELAWLNVGQSSLEAVVGDDVELVGWVARETEERSKTKLLYVKTGEDLILVSTDRQTEVAYGDVVLVQGGLAKPESFTTDLGREFDYPKYLLAKGVEYKISFAEVVVSESDQGNFIIAGLLNGKHTFMNSLERVVPEPEVALGEGLLLGVKSALGKQIEDDFRRTGIIHIVVLSGYNVMLVLTFVMTILSYFFKPKMRLVAGLLAIISFALIVGLSATVVRASVMAGLLIVAQTWGRKYDVLRALLLAGLVMLVINPFLLVYDIGFQLSFMATLGLLLVVPHFETRLAEGRNLFGWKDFLLATVSTQIAVLPLLIYHIGEISLVAVLVNLLVLPVVPIAMLLTFTAGVLSIFSATAGMLVGYFSSLFLKYILFVAEVFSRLSFATLSLPEVGFFFVFISYFVLGLTYYLLTREREDELMAGWTIVDEKETADSQSESAAEVPVFFR